MVLSELFLLGKVSRVLSLRVGLRKAEISGRGRLFHGSARLGQLLLLFGQGVAGCASFYPSQSLGFDSLLSQVGGSVSGLIFFVRSAGGSVELSCLSSAGAGGLVLRLDCGFDELEFVLLGH